MAHFGFQDFGVVTDECILWLFTSAVLDTQAKYAGATVGTFFLAFSVDAMNTGRIVVDKKISSAVWRRLFDFFAYLGQMVIAWAVMLVGMSYSTGLFLAVVFGLAVGHLVFYTERVAATVEPTGKPATSLQQV